VVGNAGHRHAVPERDGFGPQLLDPEQERPPVGLRVMVARNPQHAVPRVPEPAHSRRERQFVDAGGRGGVEDVTGQQQH
jgi:hypothetical protein